MKKEDLIHLEWIYERLIHSHNENANYDYMRRLKKIIDKQLTLHKLYESIKKAKPNMDKIKDVDKHLNFIDSDFCKCDGIQDLHAMTGECRKCGKECDY